MAIIREEDILQGQLLHGDPRLGVLITRAGPASASRKGFRFEWDEPVLVIYET